MFPMFSRNNVYLSTKFQVASTSSSWHEFKFSKTVCIMLLSIGFKKGLHFLSISETCPKLSQSLAMDFKILSSIPSIMVYLTAFPIFSKKQYISQWKIASRINTSSRHEVKYSKTVSIIHLYLILKTVYIFRPISKTHILLQSWKSTNICGRGENVISTVDTMLQSKIRNVTSYSIWKLRYFSPYCWSSNGPSCDWMCSFFSAI